MPRITVSYRRDDSSAAARAIYDRLRSRYGAESVFMDIDVVDLGEDYRKRIYQAISQTDCLLVLIGPRWLGPMENGRNRIDDANDPVRLEVERAMEMGLRVVPILLEGTQMPGPDDLPKALSEMPYLNAGDISTGREFDNQMDRIIRFIDRTFAETESRTAKVVEPAQKAVEQKVTEPKAASSFPMRAVAVAALVVLACAGAALGFWHSMSAHPVAVAPAAPKNNSPQAGGPGALAISYVAGDVAVLRGDQGTPVAAVRNAPLLPGDALATGNGGYAEVHLGRGTRLFLDANTQVRVVRAGDIGSEVQLAQGTAEMHVFKANGAQVDTPLVALVGNHPGVYALSVVGDPTVTVTALAGQATLNTQSGEQTLSAVRTVVMSGSTAATSVMNDQKAPLAFNTGFASFTATRNDAITPEFNDNGAPAAPAAPVQQDAQQDAQQPPDQSQAPDQPQDQTQDQTQAPAQIDGAEDLPAYGKWENSDYGQAWAPNEPPQWTPYSNGQWVWEPYYGYTWVAAEPWGWAPYHYGRWFYQSGAGWMWTPGAPSPWAPAQVAFIQTAGVVAWLPLAPGDPYAPWWGPNRTVVYVHDVNRYRNARWPRAFAQVPIQQFRSGNFRHVSRVAYFNLHHPTVVNVTRAVAPTRANLSFSPQHVESTARFTQQPFVGHSVAIRRTQFAPPVYHAQASRGPSFRAVSQYHSVQRAPGTAYGPRQTTHVAMPQGHTAVYGPPRSTVNAPVHSAFGPTQAHVTSQFGPSRQTSTATYATGHSFGPTQTYRPPAQTYRPTQTQTYQRPTQTQTYQRPTQGQTYRPPAQTQTYQRPVQQQTQTYQRPVQQQTQTYQRPAQTYQRPTQTYQPPAQTYTRPAPTYERPTQTYQRPAPVATVRPRY